MPQSLSQIYLHIIFSTKNRYPFINGEVETELYAYIAGIIKKQGAIPIMISGMSDHVHILTTFSRTITALISLMKLRLVVASGLKTREYNTKDLHGRKDMVFFL